MLHVVNPTRMARSVSAHRDCCGSSTRYLTTELLLSRETRALRLGRFGRKNLCSRYMPREFCPRVERIEIMRLLVFEDAD